MNKRKELTLLYCHLDNCINDNDKAYIYDMIDKIQQKIKKPRLGLERISNDIPSLPTKKEIMLKNYYNDILSKQSK